MKFMQIEPQPARGTLVESMWDDPNWIAEEKYDGDRRIAQFCGKVVRFTGRRKSVKDGLYVEKTENVPHLSACGFKHKGRITATECSTRPPPSSLDDTVLDGEMIYPIEAGGVFDKEGSRIGGLSKFVTSIMGSLPEEAIKKQLERGWLHYVVFDCLFYKGRDIRGLMQETRKAYAIDALTEWANPFAFVAPSTSVKKKLFYSKVIERGGEGVILKHIDRPYGDKQGWVKVKRQATADVVIMGFIPAKEVSKKVGGEVSVTKYAKAGLIGAIQCGQYVKFDKNLRRSECPLEEVATVSGMDDTLRAEFTKHPKKYLGKVIEIEHNGREPTGRFRHPRFNRFREDKAARDCIYREDES